MVILQYSFFPVLTKWRFAIASLLMGFWDWKGILNISITPQRSQYDIFQQKKKLTLYYLLLLQLYKLTIVQFDNWEIQLALSEAGKIDLRGDGIGAMTFRQPGQ